MDLVNRKYKEGNKESDVVVYIDTPNNHTYLTYGKSYVISHTISSFSDNDDEYIIWIMNDIDRLDYFSSNKFISLEEYRDIVINEILS